MNVSSDVLELAFPDDCLGRCCMGLRCSLLLICMAMDCAYHMDCAHHMSVLFTLLTRLLMDSMTLWGTLTKDECSRCLVWPQRKHLNSSKPFCDMEEESQVEEESHDPVAQRFK